MVKVTATIDKKITRAGESWAYIYVALGFALAIGGSIIQMLAPLKFPWNLGSYVLLMALTIWLFLDSEWLHNKLIGLKNRYETNARSL